MENEELHQVKNDCDMYLRNLKSIKKTKKEMIEFIGKPAYKTREDAIRLWEKNNEEIKKNLIPYIDKLKTILTK